MGLRGQRHGPAGLFPRKKTGTYFTGGSVGPTVRLEGPKKISPLRQSIPPYRQARN